MSAAEKTDDTVRFRSEVRPDDVLAVRRLVDATDVFRPAEVDIAVELVEERLARGTASGYDFIFADLGGRSIGYTCFGPIPCTEGSVDLYWLAVDPGEQRHGVGRILVERAEQVLREQGMRQVYIETSAGPRYAAARAFYEKQGYQRVATLADFYQPGDAKVIFQKTL
ncbi:MAG: GNAT family N-acetyltransferase [Planctomycetes bacterium]|nr:GNAT family N-acetyltransferase [Planctomycetota bacterium]